MDTNWIFHILAGLSAVILLVRSLRSRTWGFAAAALPAVLTATAGAFFFRDTAGYITLALWGVLVFLPLSGQRVLGWLASRQRYGAATHFSRGLRYLHPADGWWERHRLFHALDLGQQGRAVEAAAILEELSASSKTFGREARVHILRMHGRWEEVLTWLDAQHRGPAETWKDLSLLPIYMRALGETGEIERLVVLYSASEARLEGAGLQGLRNLCRLFVFAFTGRAERVAALFRGPLSAYPDTLKAFWRATAALTLDPDGPARDELSAMLDRPDPSLQISVRRRLERPLANPREALNPAAISLLERIERERDQEERYGPLAGGFKPYATFGLMVPILIMFAAEELFGGSQDERALVELGAFFPDLVLAGEWWRLVAATLLHYGALHLLMNLAGLYVIGPYVEFALGRVRYVLVYVFAGVGTMLVVLLLHRAGLIEPQVLVGASGAIMGLCGATGAVMWRGQRREGSRIARRRLGGVMVIIGVQAIFDWMVPNVSSISHFGGAVLGFLITSVMTHRVTPARRGCFQG